MKNIFKLLSLSVLSLSFLLISCEERNTLNSPEAPSTGTANFAKMVSIGNSLTAGYQSNALYKSSQEYSFGKMIADLVGTTYEQPYVSDPGLSDSGRIEVVSLVPFVTTYNTTQGQLLNVNYPAPYNNLGVPGAILAEMNVSSSKATSLTGNPMFDVVCRGLGTPVQQALAQNPSLITLWIGNNDILGHASRGGTIPYTPTATFDFLYGQLLDSLAKSSADVVVANIPSVTAIPYFTTVGPGIGQKIAPAVDAGLAYGLFYNTNGQFGPADLTSLATPSKLYSGEVLITLAASGYSLLIGTPTGKFYTDNGLDPSLMGIDTTKAFGLDPANPIPDVFVLDPSEIANIAAVIESYNNSISAKVAAKGYSLVDINTFFNNFATTGLTVNGIEFTSTFFTGNTFSLDGVHPTSRGYAVIANEFIKVINSDFNSTLPLIDVSTIPSSLNLNKTVQINEFGIPSAEPGVFDKVIF